MGSKITEAKAGTQVERIGTYDLDSRAYIFVAGGMPLAGIETLLVRMANQIAKLGYSVIVVAPIGPCTQLLESNVSVVEINQETDLFEQLKSINFGGDMVKKNIFFWAANPYFLISLYKLQRHIWSLYNIESISVSGIFGPARSKMSMRDRYYTMKHLLMLKWLPEGSVYFMSEAVKSTYVERLGSWFAKWPIHKLSLDKTEAIWRPSTGSQLKIVSIGRITYLKPYNFGAIDVVEYMIAKNIPIHWDIWGHGEEAELLERTIRERGLSRYITFHGELPYKKFNDTALQADLFVGMGTAALEAAQLGIPTIVALAWSKLGSYGYLHQCPSDSIGERCAGAEEANLIDLIRSYSDCPEQQRVEIGLLCRDAVFHRIGNEPAPFDAMFKSGIKCPSNPGVSMRMLSIGCAQVTKSGLSTAKKLLALCRDVVRSHRLTTRG